MPSRRYHWARWGWLGSTIGLGAALVVSAWIGHQRAVRAAEIINVGQGEAWLRSVQLVLQDFAPDADRDALDALLARHRTEGLLAIAVFDSSGRVLVQVGDSIAGAVPRQAAGDPRPVLLARTPALVQLTGTVYVAAPRPSGPGRIRPWQVSLAFTPVAARQLVAEATDIVVLSWVVAGALLTATLLFWRALMLSEDAERRAEQQRRLGMLGQMSAVLSHEIRNPLASLKGHAQLLAERLDASGADGAKARLVVREAERLEALTQDLLGFARSGPIEVRPTDPAALLRACADEVGGDHFALRTDGAPATWLLDANRMRQALTNVLRNAHQASEGATARPEAAVAEANGRLVFSVRDFGPGVSPGEESRVFEPFYTTRTTGTGLGLAVAARAVEMHQGVIRVQNHPGGGAVFTMTIPAGRT